MDWNLIQGAWDQCKGYVKKTWGRLTQDDMMVVEGKKDVLLGKLKERYGYTHEEAELEVYKFAKTCRLPAVVALDHDVVKKLTS
jgi:uncharacterized protein YjbJ (UPF0337 family)